MRDPIVLSPILGAPDFWKLPSSKGGKTSFQECLTPKLESSKKPRTHQLLEEV